MNDVVGYSEGRQTGYPQATDVHLHRGSAMSTHLLQDDGSGRIHAQLAEMARWTTKDAGKVKATFKPHPPWIMVLPPAILGVVVIVLGYLVNPDFFPQTVAISLGIMGGVALIFWFGIRAQKTRVAEHALILGRAKRIIPFATIDPGRVAVASRLRYLGVHMHAGGTRSMQSQGPTAVINGLDPKPGVANQYAPPSSVPSPFGEWGLSGEPEEVLQALESAMVDAGFPAQGMTDRALANTFTPPKMHPAEDLLVLRRALDPPIGASLH